MINKVYRQVGSVSPARSVFNLSHSKMGTCDMGELIPVLYMDCSPGDIIKMGAQLLLRMNPMVAPIMHEINAYIHVFFVPYRLLWSSWEDYITGGADGTAAPTLPTWTPSDNTVGSLWDYMGMPTGVTPTGFLPMSFPRDAYNLIYNEYYRDETTISEVALTQDDILIRAWEKDRFTSALPWQQRGTAPALPISGTTSADWSGDVPLDWPTISTVSSFNMVGDTGGTNAPFNTQTRTTLKTGHVNEADIDANTVDLSGATTFDVSDIRTAFQIQRWLERNARAGARYTEFLKAHFGVSPRDDRLDRPEYIGGIKNNVIVSEVLQTSEDGTTPQGNLAGHGISIDRNHIGSYRVYEYGIIMGIMSIMPRSVYNSQGVDRQWIKETKYDFVFPEFTNLSEVAVYRGEIFANGVSNDNNTIFGYQGKYDEHRIKQSSTHGLMRTTLDYWNVCRQFSSAPALNQTFLECVPRKDFLAVPSDPTFIYNVGNLIKGIRPIPVIAEPGYIDH